MAKRGLKSAVGVVLGIVIAVPLVATLAIWLWRNEVAEWAVVNYLIPESGFDATFDGPFDVEVSDTLDITAVDFRLTAATADGPVQEARIGRLRVALDLGRLLRGAPLLRRLEVSDSEIVIQAQDEGRAPVPAPGPRGYRLPFIEAAELINIRIVRYDADPSAPPLDEIQLVQLLETTKGGKVEIEGTVVWDGSQLAVQGSLGGTDMALDRSTPFPIEMLIRSPEFTLDLDGTVADILTGRGLDFDVAVDAPQISGLSRYANQDIPELGPLKVAARLVGDLHNPGLADLTAVVGADGRFLAKAQGAIAELAEMKGADVALSLWAEDPDLFRAYLPGDKPAPRSVEINAKLVTSAEAVALEDIVALVALPDGVELDATGTVKAPDLYGLADPDEIDIALELTSPTTLAADPWITLGIDEIGPVTATGRLAGSARDLSLIGLDLRVGSDPGVRINVTADLEHIDFEDPLRGATLQIALFANDTADLSTLFKTDIPSLGPAEFRFDSIYEVINDQTWVDRWENLSVRIGMADTVLITANGRIADFDADRAQAVRGLDLDVRVSGADVSALKTILEVGMPAGSTAEGRMRITGNSDALAVSLGDFEIGLPGSLSVKASGGVGQYNSVDGTYQDVNLTFDATAPDAGAALAGLGIDFSIEGPLESTVVLASEGTALALPRVVIQAGPNTEPTLSLDSAVANLDDPARMKANGAFRVNMSRLTRDLMEADGLDLGLASGAFSISGADKGLAVDRFNVAFDRLGALEVNATGTIDPQNEASPVGLDVQIRAASLARLAAEPRNTVLPDRALKADGRLAIGKTRVDFDGAIKVGKSDFSTNLLVDVTQPTEVTARVRGNTVYLADLGIENVPLEETTEESRGAMEQAAVNPVLFGAVPLRIERLGDIDLALSIETGPVEGRDFSMTRVSAQYDLLDGVLRAKTLAAYERGQIQLDATVDSTQEPPTISFTAIGDDLEVQNVMKEFGWSPVLEGDLHFNVDVASKGISAREFAEQLGGKALLAVDKGRIQIGDLERISSNRFQAKRAHARRSDWTELSCGVVRLNIEEGVATTDGLVLATPNVVIGGSGQIDLREETLDLVLAANREFTTASGFDKPVRVHGPITDPEVTANISGHVGDAALTGGEVAGMVALPFIFVPVRVASMLRPQLRENDTSSACLLNGEVNGDTFNNTDEAQPTN